MNLFKVFLLIIINSLCFGQFTTIPPASGGGGAITSGRVAFGDGTSTAATDSQFLWDNTNKRLQVGPFISDWSGSEGKIVSSSMREITTARGSYSAEYAGVFQFNAGNGSTGVTDLELGGVFVAANLIGNSDTTSGGGGVTGLIVQSSVYETAKTGGVISGSFQAYSGDTSQAVTVTGVDVSGTSGGSGVTALSGVRVNLTAGSNLPSASYGVYLGAVTSSSASNWNIYSEAGTGNQARNYLGGNTGIGKDSTTPTNTLYVKDGTASTGATTVVFDIGAGQSSTSTILTLGGVIRFNGQNTTGAGSAALGTNSPATTNTAPYTWIRAVSSDGSTVYIPAWK